MSPYEKRDQPVFIRVTASERKAFEAEADRCGTRLPTWLRTLARKAAGLPVPGGETAH